jgi:hypothetical protein
MAGSSCHCGAGFSWKYDYPAFLIRSLESCQGPKHHGTCQFNRLFLRQMADIVGLPHRGFAFGISTDCLLTFSCYGNRLGNIPSTGLSVSSTLKWIFSSKLPSSGMPLFIRWTRRPDPGGKQARGKVRLSALFFPDRGFEIINELTGRIVAVSQ